MRLSEIIGMVTRYFTVAFIAIIVLSIIFGIAYFGIYKRVLKGKKSIPNKKLVVLMLFIGYIIMVIGVTFLNRGEHYPSGIELSLFSSYREAWSLFTARHWQFIYLNIFMFLPFGLLLPLLGTRFQKARWTVGAAALFTLSIESFQFITGFGRFVVDDLFNNLLGGIIGYGITMGILSLTKKRIMKSFQYFAPLLLVIGVSVGGYTYYSLKEFGNLSIIPSNKIDMKNAKITTDVNFGDNKKSVPIYQTESYTKSEADRFAENFYEKIQMDPSKIDDISYPGLGIYRINDRESYSLSIEFLDGSYDFLDFSSLNPEIKPKDADEETIKKDLKRFGIEIPNGAEFHQDGTGEYRWTVDQVTRENQLIDGLLEVSYFDDDTVKKFNHRLITYDKVKDVQIKSEKNAYEEIVKGNFQFYIDNNKIDTIQIHGVKISYYLDSKSYYQPIYEFHSSVNGNDFTILIPGL